MRRLGRGQVLVALALPRSWRAPPPLLTARDAPRSGRSPARFPSELRSRSSSSACGHAAVNNLPDAHVNLRACRCPRQGRRSGRERVRTGGEALDCVLATAHERRFSLLINPQPPQRSAGACGSGPERSINSSVRVEVLRGARIEGSRGGDPTGLWCQDGPPRSAGL